MTIRILFVPARWKTLEFTSIHLPHARTGASPVPTTHRHPTFTSMTHRHSIFTSTTHRHPTFTSTTHRHPTFTSTTHRHPTFTSMTHRLLTLLMLIGMVYGEHSQLGQGKNGF